MGKKVLVITGSPRKKGNTFAMADVHGCVDCKTCYSTGKPCTHDDDFNKVAPDILDADAI